MIATLFDERPCALGEGPLWHPERKQLFWFDILGKRLLSRDGDAPLEWHFDEHVSAAGWVDHDTLLIASETQLFTFDLNSGESTYVAPLEVDNAITRSNDGRADPQGGFWIGTMGKNAEPGAGAIYRFYQGNVTKLYPDITIPNSICFSPDGRTAYFCDTTQHRIMRQTLDVEGWPEGLPEVFIADKNVNFDGTVVDVEGALWNADFGHGRVVRYLPDGQVDRIIKTGGTQTTCPAFGGVNLATLYVTTARIHLESASDADGCLFVAEAGINGLPEHQVKL